MTLVIQLFIALSIGAVIGFLTAGILCGIDDGADCATCALVERGEKE